MTAEAPDGPRSITTAATCTPPKRPSSGWRRDGRRARSSSPPAPRTWPAPTGSCCPATAPSRPAARRLGEHGGLFEAIDEAVSRQGRPFLGICVGMQMLATRGLEYEQTRRLRLDRRRSGADHPRRPGAQGAAHGLERSGDRPPASGAGRASRPAITPISCIPTSSAWPTPRTGWPMSTMAARSRPSSARDNIVGTQFHPEKSQAAGPAPDRQLPALAALSVASAGHPRRDRGRDGGRRRIAARSPATSRTRRGSIPNQFGIAVALPDGQVLTAGDAHVPFSIQSISKVFMLAIALGRLGDSLWPGSGASRRDKPSTRSSSSRSKRAGRAIPFINAGAIVVTDAILAGRMPREVLAELLALHPHRGRRHDIHINEAVARSETDDRLPATWRWPISCGPMATCATRPNCRSASISTNARSR